MREVGLIALVFVFLIGIFAFGISLHADLTRDRIKRCVTQNVTLEVCSKINGWIQ